MSPEEVRSCLRTARLLESLSEESLTRLAGRVHAVTWNRGRRVLRTGEPGGAMMIVVQGRVKITARAPNGRERILDLIGPGETFGELALLDGEPRCADAKAVEPTTAIVLGREVFEELLESDPVFARHVIADLCARVRKVTALVEDTLFLSSAVRLARRLRAMVQPNGVPVDGQALWTVEGLSQQELADAVGMTRENVNRLLRAWQAAGIVTLRQRAVVVHDVVELQRIACDVDVPD